MKLCSKWSLIMILSVSFDSFLIVLKASSTPMWLAQLSVPQRVLATAGWMAIALGCMGWMLVMTAARWNQVMPIPTSRSLISKRSFSTRSPLTQKRSPTAGPSMATANPLRGCGTETQQSLWRGCTQHLWPGCWLFHQPCPTCLGWLLLPKPWF